MIKQIIIIIAALNILNCGSGAVSENGEHRGWFHWSGTIVGVGYSNYWTIECSNDCDTCYATKGMASDAVKLDKDKHEEIFKYCLTLPVATIIDDPTDTVVIPLGEVTFNKADSIFGMDEWRTCKGGPEEINYRSIAAGGHARVNILLTDGIKSSYTKIVAILDEPGAQNYVSFGQARNVDTLNLNRVSNDVTIYSDTATPDETIVEVKVLGITDPKQPACLAGDCQGSGDRLQIVVYQQKVLTDNYLYYVNNPDTQPSPAYWKQAFNAVLKQAVVEIDTVYASALEDSAWDINGNGMVDCLVGLGMFDTVAFGSNIIWNELGLMVPDTDDCYINGWSSTFIVKHQLRMHYILEINATIGDTVLYFNTVEGLEVGKSLRLSPFHIPDSIEYLYIEAIYIANNSIEFRNMKPGSSGLEKNYNKNNAITASTDELSVGITPKAIKSEVECASCSFASSRPINTYVHEFLHQFKNGNLKHVGDEADPKLEIDNIMYPTSSRTGTRLRYRTLLPYHISSTDQSQNQWSQMH